MPGLEHINIITVNSAHTAAADFVFGELAMVINSTKGSIIGINLFTVNVYLGIKVVNKWFILISRSV